MKFSLNIFMYPYCFVFLKYVVFESCWVWSLFLYPCCVCSSYISLTRGPFSCPASPSTYLQKKYFFLTLALTWFPASSLCFTSSGNLLLIGYWDTGDLSFMIFTFSHLIILLSHFFTISFLYVIIWLKSVLSFTDVSQD